MLHQPAARVYATELQKGMEKLQKGMEKLQKGMEMLQKGMEKLQKGKMENRGFDPRTSRMLNGRSAN